MTHDALFSQGPVNWDLGALYSHPNDPALEADMHWCREAGQKFQTQYQGKIATLKAAQISQMIAELEALYVRLGRLGTFSYLHYVTQTHNATASALMQRLEEFSSEVQKELVFFDLEWAAIPDEIAATLLADPKIEPYRHYLQAQRRYRPHLLSQKEEELLTELAPTGASAWTNLFEKVISKIAFGEGQRSLEEVLADLYHAARPVREQAAQDLTAGLQSQAHVLTFIFNTLAANKTIHDRLRRYPHWLRSRNLSNEIEDETVETLKQSVTSRYDLPQRYYRLKRQLLGLEQLFDYDRYAPLPQVEQPPAPWEECREIVLKAYAEFSPEMAGIARRFFEEQWIDATLKPGKRGGAFAHSATPDTHPFVLVNYTGTRRDIDTVAHELGHGIHQWLSARHQTYFNTYTPLTIAESASVFGEMLVFQYQLRLLNDPKAKLSLLCNKLESMFATVFRQIAMARFEDAMHQARRQEGELSEERLSELWMETQRPMFADAVELQEHYQIWWAYIPHFLNSPGYVYAYAFGELLVLALYQRYRQEGQAFVSKYLELLSAGGKEAPAELLKPFGIDLNDPLFWQQGLKTLEEMLEEAEKLGAEVLKPSA